MASVNESSGEAFETALADLIRIAEREGVELERARDVEGVGTDCTWMVEITRVRSEGDDGR